MFGQMVNDPFTADTQESITVLNVIFEALTLLREHGYSLSDDELQKLAGHPGAVITSNALLAVLKRALDKS